MKKERFTVGRDGLTIHGIAYLSDENCKRPVVIMSQGFQGNYTGFEYFAERFFDYGFSVFCYNFCGGSVREDFEYKSDGDSRDMCITSEINDLVTVFEYVRNHAQVDTANIYLLGESQGALVSGLAAARLQEQIKKLIMIFPAVCIPDHARRGTLGGASYDPKNPPEEMVLPLTTIGIKLHNDVVDLDVYSKLAEYNGETLIMQGTDDDIVMPHYQYLVKDQFDFTDKEMWDKNGISEKDRKHRCRLQMIRNMGHMSSEAYRDGMFDSMKQFIEGREEILTFRIICTEVVNLDRYNEFDRGDTPENKLPIHRQDVYFTGYCENPLFTGTITKGVDHQAYQGDRCLKMHAEYVFTGIDLEGLECKMKVVNTRSGENWKPVIETNSKALHWLNGADLTAVVENGQLGPTIRIYK